MKNKLSALTNSTKFVVSLLGTLGVGLETAYPGAKFTPVVTSAIASVLVWLVANSGNAKPPVQ